MKRHVGRTKVFTMPWFTDQDVTIPLYGPRNAKTYADSGGPDQPAHPRSLIRAFSVRYQNHWILQCVSMESKDPDETLRVRRIM